MESTTQLVAIDAVRHHPQNPRLIKDNRFEQLVQSLIEFPDMLQARPLVVDESGVVLGGNMRLHAALRLSYTEIPILRVTGWSEAKKREFMIKDNASFGEWNWDVLANEWSDSPLGAWGIDLPADWLAEPEEASSGSGSDDSPDGGAPDEEEEDTRPSMILRFATPEQLAAAETDITELIDRKYNGASYTVQVGLRNG
jgi:hypothetical protein